MHKLTLPLQLNTQSREDKDPLLIDAIHIKMNWQLSKSGIHWQISHDHLAGSHEKAVSFEVRRSSFHRHSEGGNNNKKQNKTNGKSKFLIVIFIIVFFGGSVDRSVQWSVDQVSKEAHGLGVSVFASPLNTNPQIWELRRHRKKYICISWTLIFAKLIYKRIL